MYKPDQMIKTRAEVEALLCHFCEQHPLADAGPGHIVFADFNLETEHIRWCIQLVEGCLGIEEFPDDWEGGDQWGFAKFEYIEQGLMLYFLLMIDEAIRLDGAP